MPRDSARARRTIEARRRPERGTRFELDAADRGAARVTQAMHQVLVIEDEPGIRHVLRVLLEGEDIE